MNKHVSVYMLNLRRVFYKVLLIVSIMCVVEAVLLYNGTKEFFEYANEIFSYEDMSQTAAKYLRSTSIWITAIFTDSKAHLVFMAAFIAICGVFILNALELGGSRSSYTVHRLSVNRKLYVLWESMAYLTCIIIFYASQVAMSAAFIVLYNYLGGTEYYSSQSALIMFYENDFLHSLLPLRDISRIIRNIAMMLSLAVCAGCYAHNRRRGVKPIALLAVVAIIVFSFQLELGRWGTDVMITLLLLSVTAAAVVNMWRIPNEN